MTLNDRTDSTGFCRRGRIVVCDDKVEMTAEYIVRETMHGLVSTRKIISELVRCKDCKHRKTITMDIFPEIKVYACDYVSGYMGEDGFCSKGERKEHEGFDRTRQGDKGG